jgi:hypothetical protein
MDLKIYRKSRLWIFILCDSHLRLTAAEEMRQREEELLRENIRREELMLREELLMRREEPMMVDREEMSLRRRESDYLRGGVDREAGVGSASMSEALRMYVADDRKLEEYQRARNQAVYGRGGGGTAAAATADYAAFGASQLGGGSAAAAGRQGR